MNDWLDSTVRLQLEAYGFDFAKLDGVEQMEYIIWNFTALTVELGEFMANLHWKPWAKQRGEVHDREEAIGELIDVGHFLANLCCALQVTDDEWDRRYHEKQAINRARQASGSYTGRYGNGSTAQGNAGSADDGLQVAEASGTHS